jgi:broad specificity phosphatase PhoE
LLGLDKNIERLHDSWDGNEEDEDGRARYQDLAETLKGLDERRKAVRGKVAGYKRLKEMLGPLERATETMQPNLVARDGELEKELEKMRLLVARVRGRVEALPGNVAAEEEMDVDLPDEGEKVAALF